MPSQQRLFLSGPMGSGKSTLAIALAAKTGLRAWDLDREIEARVGKPVAHIFEEQGEAAFRVLERECLTALLAEPAGIIALGGGTVTHAPTRRDLLGRGVLITLDAELDELVRRVGSGAGRPLLAGNGLTGNALAGADVRERLKTLLQERAAAYAECHARVATTDRDPDSITSEIMDLLSNPPITVALGEQSYRVEIGAGLRARVPAQLARIATSGNVLLVSDETVGPLWADAIGASLREHGLRVSDVRIPAGEEHKGIRTVEKIWDAALDAELDRGSALLGVGGGVVGDLTGFAAATVLRGLPVGHMPTTLLAMVDSAVGGKTGFDTRHGKNLVGAFHQPSFVVCDTDVLSTLPLRELRAGFAEVVKSAWIDSETAVAQLEADRDALNARDEAATQRAIRMAVALKAKVVSEDAREGGLRAVLNLGHTVGHAIEVAAEYTGFLHGEAVSLGLVAAFRLSQRFGAARPEHAERMLRLLSGLGLPTNLDEVLTERALSFLGADKKRRGATLTLVLPAAAGHVDLSKVALADVRAALLERAGEH